MRYVVVPEDVHLMFDKKRNKPALAVEVIDGKQVEKPVVWSHEKFVADYICTAPAMNRGGGKALRRVVKILGLFENAQPGNVIGVEDEDYEVVRAVVDSIEWTANMVRYAHQMLPHIEAWEKAKDQGEEWKKNYDKRTKMLRSVDSDDAVAEESPKAG